MKILLVCILLLATLRSLAADDLERVSVPSLQGLWSTDCDASGQIYFETLGFASSRTEYAFSGSVVLRTLKLFADSNCKEPRFKIEQSGTATIGVRTPAPFAFIDFTFENPRVTIADPRFTDLFNTLYVCGITDWRLNEARSVDAGRLFCAVFDRAARFDLIHADEKTVYFGLKTFTASGATVRQRPMVVDYSSPFYKREPGAPELANTADAP